MEHCRKNGIASHEDIKPSNILVDGNGLLRITDFGLARAVDLPLASAASLSSNFQNVTTVTVALDDQQGVAGTPGYMAPELLASGSAGARSDVYSFGLVLWQMVTGSPVSPLIAQVNQQPQSVVELIKILNKIQRSSSIPKTDTTFDPIIAKCVALDPKARYGSFSEVAQDVSRIRVARGYDTSSHEMVASWRRTYTFLMNKGGSLMQLGLFRHAIDYYDAALKAGDATDSHFTFVYVPHLLRSKGKCLEALGLHEEAAKCVAEAQTQLEEQRRINYENMGVVGERPDDRRKIEVDKLNKDYEALGKVWRDSTDQDSRTYGDGHSLAGLLRILSEYVVSPDKKQEILDSLESFTRECRDASLRPVHSRDAPVNILEQMVAIVLED